MNKINYLSLFILLTLFSIIKPIYATNIPGVQSPIPINPTPAYIGASCPNQYYTYNQPLKQNSPTLQDAFDGKAHFQSADQAERIKLTFNPNDVSNVWDQKMPILFNPADNNYYAFTRGYNSPNDRFTIYMMKSSDGINFNEVGEIFSKNINDSTGYRWIYDAHISIDYSVCPNQYIMALECGGNLCMSHSSTPFDIHSWSTPKLIVKWDTTGSASTGAFLIDGYNKYVSWTVVDRPGHSTYTRGIQVTKTPISSLSDFFGSSTGNILLPAGTDTHCTSPWDCNNRDKQDWKKEGNYFYLLYNGANYYDCTRDKNDTGTNDWGIGIVRSLDPLKNYNLNGLGKIIDSGIKNTCGTSYPVLNNINGELFMYYAYRGSPTDTLRSKLVWNDIPQNAVFISQNVPTTMNVGHSYPITITLKNTGTTSWTLSEKYNLGSQNPRDNTSWGTGRVRLSPNDNIQPKGLGTKTFTFTAIAPNTPGIYNFQWQMMQEGVRWFGDLTPNVSINVTSSTTTKPGDFNYDGSVNLLDFAFWKTKYLQNQMTLFDFAAWKTAYLLN